MNILKKEKNYFNYNVSEKKKKEKNGLLMQFKQFTGGDVFSFWCG